MMKPTNYQVANNLEFKLASELGDLLRELSVGEFFAVSPSADICYALELFLPQLLRSRYPEWETESLDGIFVARAIKTGVAAAQFAGTCILISDQTVTPFLIDLELSPLTASVAAVRVMLGEPGRGRLKISGPPCNSHAARQMLESLISRLNRVAWTYTVASPSSQ